MINFKKVIATLSLVFILVSSLFAADEWYVGKAMTDFRYTGLQNVSEKTIDALLSDYVGMPYSDDAFNEITDLLYSQNWMEWFIAEANTEGEEMNLVIDFEVHETPYVNSVNIVGNNKIRSSALSEILDISKGDFFNYTMLGSNAILLKNDYLSKGYRDVTVEPSYELDEATNRVSVKFDVNEGKQYKVREILFENISGVSAKELNKLLKTKAKSFFNAGNLVESTIYEDEASILSYYATKGYPDAVVSELRIEPTGEEKDNVVYMNVIFSMDEGSRWTIGTINITGNEVFSDEEVAATFSIKEGAILNIEDISLMLQNLSTLYYDNGYIRAYVNPIESRDEDTHTISYDIQIFEGPQSVVEEILITGLTKTKPYVFERELNMKVGDIFSRADYIKSQQNLMNTGLLKGISAEIYAGSSSDGVIVEFIVEEGNQMELQFGATFGGTAEGFPISGFLQWADKNLSGTGRDLSVGTTLSPTTQSVSFSIADDWVGDQRWSNGVSVSLERSVRKGALQKGIGSEFFDGRDNNKETYPLGYSSSYDWYKSNITPSLAYLMNYDYYRIALGYNTGYSFVWNPGTLTVGAGVSIGLNHAVYNEDNFTPYELLIKKYHDKWQFSNMLSFNLSWDGRDLKTNTTRGYIVSLDFTYAGGVLQGLSNYNRFGLNTSAYHSLYKYVTKEGKEKNLVLSGTSNISLMLPQYWNNPEDGGWGWHAPQQGATKYEMLYIDGMNIGRGFNVVYDQSFLWHNQLEVTYPLIDQVLGLEAFASATGIASDLEKLTSFSKINWYLAGGAGVKMQIPGFPLGLYLVKNATITEANGFAWDGGFVFHSNNRPNSGLKLVLAITTSLF